MVQPEGPFSLTLQELAELVGGELAPEAKADERIHGAAALDEAIEGEVTFFAHARYLAALKRTRASALIVARDFAEPHAAALIRVENPSAAFTQVVKKFIPAPISYEPGVHPTAVIGSGVILGEEVSIQPYAVIEAGAQIGARSVVGAHGFIGANAKIGSDCRLHPRVTVAARCLLGNRVIIQSGTVIGGDGFGYEFSAGRHVKIPQVGMVQIEDDVEIGVNAAVDRARFGRTWIQEGTKIDNLVQIAHNVVVGKHSILVAQVGISGSSRLGNYVTLAGQVGLAGHLEVGDQATVGAQSGVNKSLSGHEVYMGYPVQKAREWREEVALLHRLKKLFARVKALESPENEQVPRSTEF